jgi:hypothetical protein
MRNLFVCLFFLASAVAFAGNEGPNASPRLPPPVEPVVAKIVINIPLTPPGMVNRFTIAIHSDGSVDRADRYFEGNSVLKPVAILSPELSAKINAVANAAVKTEMVDQDPGAPECTDAGSGVYSAVNALGEIILAEDINCKKLRSKSAMGPNQVLVDILENVLELSNQLSN